MKVSDVSGVAAVEDFDNFVLRCTFLGVVSSSAAFRFKPPDSELLPPTGVDGADRVEDRVTGMINLSVDCKERASLITP
jgi:hypothetical protein